MKLLLKCLPYLILAVMELFSGVAFSQAYKIGSIDIYGNRIVSTTVIYNTLTLKEGDSINFESFKGDEIAENLKQVPGVKYSAVFPVCCDPKGEALLFIGIGENDSVIIKHRNSPGHDIKLPLAMQSSYNHLMSELEPAIRQGEATEDDAKGYSLIKYAPARKEQMKFIQFANRKFPMLANVIKNSRYPAHRAAAADIIAYGANRKQVVDVLLYASDDADDAVRNNATRALGILAGYAATHPALKISVPAGPFIKMMNSIVWTDRNKGSMLLMQLTQNKDRGLLNKIKQEALLSVAEMAKWKDRSHSSTSLVVLARIAGVDERELMSITNQEDLNAKVDALVDAMQVMQ